MDFYFQKQNPITEQTEMQAIVHISQDADLGMVKVTVDLDGLPIHLGGYEVIAQFQVSDFHNNQTFFTDSNGLEMQKRILNYRPTWDIQANYNQSNENITANYYPIQSAISMKDGSRVFTVMNDRSQGGSALSEGTIEFMQNRRIPADDSRGMGEWLNETDSQGNPIRVPATYHVQVFNEDKTENNQRRMQMRIESPPQFFFTFDEVKPKYESNIGKELKAAGIVDMVKLVTIPKSQDRVLIRLENTGDFLIKGAKTQIVDLNKALGALYPSVQSFEVREKSLTGNMDIQEMLDRKINWLPGKQKLDRGSDFSQVKLELQRIRVFEVTAKKEQLFMQ